MIEDKISRGVDGAMGNFFIVWTAVVAFVFTATTSWFLTRYPN